MVDYIVSLFGEGVEEIWSSHQDQLASPSQLLKVFVEGEAGESS